MTNEELFDDLKHFIDRRQEQLEERLGARMDGIEAKMVTKQDLEVTERRILEAVGDTISHANDAVDKQLDDHERRLKRLEHRTA